jgi:hypothetical protein
MPEAPSPTGRRSHRSENRRTTGPQRRSSSTCMLADRDSELSSASRAAVAALRPSSSRRGEAALRLRRHRGEMGAAKTKDGATLPSVSLASRPCQVLCARRWCRVRRVGQKVERERERWHGTKGKGCWFFMSTDREATCCRAVLCFLEKRCYVCCRACHCRCVL